MRILTRYVLRAHIGPFLFALTVLTSLLMVNTVARRFEELAGKGLPISVIAEVFVLSIPHIIALTLPMAVLVAVLYTFSRLAADNEVTALKANGIHLGRLLGPLLIAGTVIAAGMVYFNDQILPQTNYRLKNLLIDIARKSPTLELEEQIINSIETDGFRTRYFLRAAQIQPATNRLWDIAIYDMSQTGRIRTIYADSGRMAFNRERTDLFLTLHDGSIHETSVEEPANMQRLNFERQRIRLQGVGDRLERHSDRAYRGDREMSLDQLAAAADEKRAELAEVREDAMRYARWALSAALAGGAQRVSATSATESATATAESATAAADSGRARPLRWVASGDRTGSPDEVTASTMNELRTLEGRATSLLHRISQYEVEYHKKYSIPFACIIFILIGAPVAVRFPRGGVGMVIATSLAVFSVYYMGLIGGEELADEGIISPFWAMWAPNLLFLGLGIWGYIKTGREASTTRGGGWDDLRHTLSTLAARPLRLLTARQT